MMFRRYAFLFVFFTLGHYVRALTPGIAQPFDSIANQIETICYSEGTVARDLLKTLYAIAEKQTDRKAFLSRCLYLESNINSAQAHSDSSLVKAINNELNLLDEEKDTFEIALLHYALAMNYWVESDYGKSFSMALFALNRFQELNNRPFISKVFNLLGNICRNIRNDSMAEDYYQQALAFIEPGQINDYQIRVNLFLLHAFMTHEIQAALDSIENLIEPMARFQDQGSLVALYLNLGGGYAQLQKKEKAFFPIPTCGIQACYNNSNKH
jgi:tetratricopeptide (TPR) repeat protein